MKPWFKQYKTYQKCLDANNTFCEAFWVNLSHKVVDNTMPLFVSDGIWSITDTWKHKRQTEFQTLVFYGPCAEEYTISLMGTAKMQTIERWSYFQDSNCRATTLQ